MISDPLCSSFQHFLNFCSCKCCCLSGWSDAAAFYTYSQLLLSTVYCCCCCCCETSSEQNFCFVSSLYPPTPLPKSLKKNHGPLHIRFYNINQFSFKAHCLFFKPYFKVLARELKIPFYLLLSHVCTRFHFDVPYSQYIRLQQNVEEGDSRLEQKGVWEVDEIFIIRFLS